MSVHVFVGIVHFQGLLNQLYTFRGNSSAIFSLPGQSPGRAIVLPPASVLGLASALAKCYGFYIQVFYVMGKALSGELSCPCDRSC